ncbi:MAG TPA: hypothetical protein DD856_16225 [Sulfobacillus sp.]|nr:hypothetical protein [Sulfobacillus sp.]
MKAPLAQWACQWSNQREPGAIPSVVIAFRPRLRIGSGWDRLEDGALVPTGPQTRPLHFYLRVVR